MHQVLLQLIELQAYDQKLAEIESLKGDLPLQIRHLREEVELLKKKHQDHEEKYQAYQKEQGIMEMEIKALEGKQVIYQNQLYQVKNNREYDAITHELESLKGSKSEKETRVLELLDLITEMKNQMDIVSVEIVEHEKNIDSKIAELNDRLAVTEKEELIYRDKRDKVVRQLKPQMVMTYERIRHAKNGLAVVALERGACGGCHKSLPPQKVLEVRQMNSMHLCEVCGRILIWKEGNTYGS